MRLIDADALKREEICAFEYGTFKPSTGWIVDGKTVDDAPTVKAIPIDFLERWFGDNYYAFVDLMMEWEKENGKN